MCPEGNRNGSSPRLKVRHAAIPGKGLVAKGGRNPGDRIETGETAREEPTDGRGGRT